MESIGRLGRASTVAMGAPALVASLMAGGPAAAQIVFEPPAGNPLGHICDAVISGDVNADGHADLVSMPRWNIVTFDPAQVSVLLGNGDGTFGAPLVTTLDNTNGGRGFLAHMDGDPHLDLVLGRGGVDHPEQSGVDILHGTGAGTFSSVTAIPISSQTAIVQVLPAHLDQDGLLDVIAVSAGPGFGSVHALMAVAGGGFQVKPGFLQLPVPTAYAAVGDVDEDGLLDVLATGDGMHLVSGVPGGGFAMPVAIWIAGFPLLASPKESVLHDFDGDGHLDLAVADELGGRLAIGTGDGTGAFTLVQQFFLGGDPRYVTSGDLDGDGLLDLLVSSTLGYDVSVLRGAADGTFALLGKVSNVPYPGGSALADLDEDGTLDVAVGRLGNVGAVTVLRNHTYAAGSPFTDLGHAFPGSNGWPIHLAEGTLQAGTPVSFALHNAKPLGYASLVLGFSQVDAPFKGGVMVPAVDVLISPLPIDAAGSTAIGGAWPAAVPAGFTVYLQYWFKDAGALYDEAGSSAVRVIAP